MSIAKSARIHPTAIVSSEVVLGENVDVGAFAILDGNITLGDDCIVRPSAHIFGTVNMGRGNEVFTGAVLGEKPQHLRYANEPTRLDIGDGNVFREHVTIHRGTAATMTTRIGNNNYFMANCHIAHDCIVGNRCILANGALVAGHCVLEDNVYMSGNSAVHQFIRLGRLSMLSGCTITTKDVPPFVIQQGINAVVGINVVGMKRAGMASDQIAAVRQAFRYIFRSNLTMPAAVERMEKHLAHSDAVQEILKFLRNSPKGINLVHSRNLEEAA